MDVSVLWAVGSFWVSERVLKPKATVLVILGCVLAYDLTTKTHDVSSLRVYRGPALLAFTLIMCAYSLRTWRRNGVACDEFLFLPGTAHGQAARDASADSTVATSSPTQQQKMRSEGDVAAGVGRQQTPSKQQSIGDGPSTRKRSFEMTEIPISLSSGGDDPQEEMLPLTRSMQDDSGYSVGYESDAEGEEIWENEGTEGSYAMSSTTIDGRCPAPHNFLCQVSRSEDNGSIAAEERTHADSDLDEEEEIELQGRRHRITRIGSFFFFRSSATSTHNAAYAPSGPSVVGAALDLSMPIFVNFHLFIEAYNHVTSTGGSEVPAKILPLIFLSVLIVRTFFPPGRRGRFWSTMKFTFMAPFHRVLFRDAYLGDVLTSLIRPMQDVLFALSYYLTVISGTVSGKYGMSESGRYLERSWLLHNVVLPSCALLPLWWKFLQTLRQCYDTKRRWPHLGNAFKYLSATVVILYGMTHKEDRRSHWWIVGFVATVMYQIWWDTFMDWELFEVAPPRPDVQSIDVEEVSMFSRISSIPPSSRTLFTLHVRVFHPLKDMLRRVSATIGSWRHIKLRSRRLYKTQSFYWQIFFYNVITRFAWMLCFIPAYRLSSSGEEIVTTFSSDVNSYVGVLLPMTEILRRTLWGFLYLERETLDMMDADCNYSYSRAGTSVADDDHLDDLADVETQSSTSTDACKRQSLKNCLPSWLNVQLQLQHDAATRGGTSIGYLKQVFDWVKGNFLVAELTLWAVSFVILGCWAAS